MLARRWAVRYRLDGTLVCHGSPLSDVRSFEPEDGAEDEPGALLEPRSAELPGPERLPRASSALAPEAGRTGVADSLAGIVG